MYGIPVAFEISAPAKFSHTSELNLAFAIVWRPNERAGYAPTIPLEKFPGNVDVLPSAHFLTNADEFFGFARGWF
jgi:hypothetical protein